MSLAYVIYPKSNIDPSTRILGISLLERAAAMLHSVFDSAVIYAPFLTSALTFRNIEIRPTPPPAISDVLLVDPALLYNKAFAENLVSRFSPSCHACDPESLSLLGFSLIQAKNIDSDFWNDPWHFAEKEALANLDTRVAVIEGAFFSITSKKLIPYAERYLTDAFSPHDDGLISRTLYRYVSHYITHRIAALDYSPAFWTFISFCFGLSGALFLLPGTYYTDLIGVLLLLGFSITSGIDGELAFLTFRRTRAGRFLNLFSADIVMVSFLACLTWSMRNDSIVYFSGITLLILYGIFMAAKIFHLLFLSRGSVSPRCPRIIHDISTLGRHDLVTFFFCLILVIFGEIRLFTPLYLASTIIFIISLLGYSIIAGLRTRKHIA